MTYIYILERKGIPFYVGKTKNPTRRKHTHYKKYNTDINLVIIDECSDDREDWKFWESYWIEQFKSWNFILDNKNNGGGGPSLYSEESKLKMRKPRREGTGKKISETLLANNHSKYYTDEIRDKMKISLKGSHGGPFTQSHIKNLTESFRKHKGKKLYQFDLQGNFIKEWRSKGEAVEELGLKNKYKGNLTSQIKDCCLKKQKSAFNYIWSYEKDANKLDTKPLIYQFDLDKNLKNTFISRKELVSFIKQERPNCAIDSIATAINRESKLRIYKSGNHYYTIKNKI